MVIDRRPRIVTSNFRQNRSTSPYNDYFTLKVHHPTIFFNRPDEAYPGLESHPGRSCHGKATFPNLGT